MLYGKTVRIIFASPVYAQNGKVVIGKNGNMPWRGLVPSDMVRFKRLTSEPGENSVIEGRKTWDSIPEKFRPFDKDLPQEKSRQSVVVTRNQNFKVDDPRVVVAHSLEEAIRLAKSETVWIIGGAEIYALALEVADFINQTLIYGGFNGDTFFPGYDTHRWKNVHFEHFEAGGTGAEKDKIGSSYLVFARRK